jgi:hypothetical protein
MAHPCIHCGSECYCHGSIDDTITDKTPKNCDGCGCADHDFEDEGDDNCPNCGREYDEIDHEYQICNRCGFSNNVKPARTGT